MCVRDRGRGVETNYVGVLGEKTTKQKSCVICMTEFKEIYLITGSLHLIGTLS